MKTATIQTIRGEFNYNIALPKSKDLLVLEYWGLGIVTLKIPMPTSFVVGWLRIEGYSDLYAAPISFEPAAIDGKTFNVIIIRSFVAPLYQDHTFKTTAEHADFLPLLQEGMVIRNPSRLRQEGILVKGVQSQRRHPYYWAGIMHGISETVFRIGTWNSGSTNATTEPIVITPLFIEQLKAGVELDFPDDYFLIGANEGRNIVAELLPRFSGKTITTGLLHDVTEKALDLMRHIPGWFSFRDLPVG